MVNAHTFYAIAVMALIAVLLTISRKTGRRAENV